MATPALSQPPFFSENCALHENLSEKLAGLFLESPASNPITSL